MIKKGLRKSTGLEVFSVPTIGSCATHNLGVGERRPPEDFSKGQSCVWRARQRRLARRRGPFRMPFAPWLAAVNFPLEVQKLTCASGPLPRPALSRRGELTKLWERFFSGIAARSPFIARLS